MLQIIVHGVDQRVVKPGLGKLDANLRLAIWTVPGTHFNADESKIVFVEQDSSPVTHMLRAVVEDMLEQGEVPYDLAWNIYLTLSEWCYIDMRLHDSQYKIEVVVRGVGNVELATAP